MATLEEMVRKRGKALVEDYGMKPMKTKGTESMYETQDYSGKVGKRGPKDKGGDYKLKDNDE
jgi:hypothetical protein